MTNDINLKIENLIAGFRLYGYTVVSDPIKGEEQAYHDHLQAGLRRVEKEAEFLRKTYRLRGRSRRLINMLRNDMPEPCWGVTI